jgi:RNA polymerase sigma-70 factor, ECF subfamily
MSAAATMEGPGMSGEAARTARTADGPRARDTGCGTAADGAKRVGQHWFEAEVPTLLPGLLAAARRLTRNDTDAEDLVAEAMAKALGSLASLRDRSLVRGWLCRILTNTYFSQQRSPTARAETEEYHEGDGSEESFSLFDRLHQPFLLWQANPERDFLNRLLQEDVACAVDMLPEEFRVVVVLVEIQGLSYQEAAEALGIPVGTVRSRLARGRSRLQKSLWDQAVDMGLRTHHARAPEEEAES